MLLTRYVPLSLFCVAAQDFTAAHEFAATNAKHNVSATHSIYVAALEIDDLDIYDEHHRHIIQILQTMTVPENVPRSRKHLLHMEATKYHIAHEHLFHRGNKANVSRCGICHDIDKCNILVALHDNSGHRGWDAIVKKVMEYYCWRNLYKDVENHIKNCYRCQKRQNVRVEEVVHPNLTSAM